MTGASRGHAPSRLERTDFAIKWTLFGFVFDAPVGVFKTHNVVFSQITARLDLDHFQFSHAWVVQAVHFANGDVGGLVLAQ